MKLGEPIKEDHKSLIFGAISGLICCAVLFLFLLTFWSSGYSGSIIRIIGILTFSFVLLPLVYIYNDERHCLFIIHILRHLLELSIEKLNSLSTKTAVVYPLIE